MKRIISAWECMECGYVTKTDITKCPKCGSYDIDIAEVKPPPPRKKEREES